MESSNVIESHISSQNEEREYVSQYDPANDPLHSRKMQLIDELKRICGTSAPDKKPLNILVIGTPGCGKSSFINTVMASVRTDKWVPYAAVGDPEEGGDISNVTNHFQSFSAKLYYKEEPDVLFPTFIDINGLESNSRKFNEIVLKALLEGKVKENQQLKELNENFKENASDFQLMLNSNPEHLKVDRIVVVASADPDVPLPTELLGCVKRITRFENAIPVFGLMTKADKFPRNEKLNARIADFTRSIGITKDNFKLITNYSPDVDEELRYHSATFPKIDVPILELMKQIVNKEMRTFHMDKSPFHRFINLFQCLTGKHSDESASVELGIQFFLQGLFLGILFYWASIPSISDSKLNEICSSYHVESKQKNFEIKGLEDVCSQWKELTSVSLFFPVVISLVILAIPILSTRLLPRSGNST